VHVFIQGITLRAADKIAGKKKEREGSHSKKKLKGREPNLPLEVCSKGRKAGGGGGGGNVGGEKNGHIMCFLKGRKS